jgi:hypothetical protein
MVDIRHFARAAGQPGLVAWAAVAAGAAGLLSTVPVWSPLQAVLLLVFILAGPGCAAMCWAALPPAVTVAAAIGLSVASVIATSVAMAWVPLWGPVPSCLVLSAAASASGLLRVRALHRSAREAALPW